MNRAGFYKTSYSTLSLVVIVMFVVGLMPRCAHAQQDHIQWHYDLEKAKQVAGAEDKLILLHFSASWCGPCKEIERFVFVNPLAIRAIDQQVVPVKVDVDINSDIAQEYGVESVPYDVIITPAGHVVSERSSPRSTDGYVQLIKNAQSAGANLSKDVASQVRDLKREMKRQQKQLARKEAEPKSYGSLATSDVNQFKSTYEAPKGVEVPTFENPKPWATNQAVPAAAKDGVVQNQFASRESKFAPAAPSVSNPADGQVAPSHQAPEATAFQKPGFQNPESQFKANQVVSSPSDSRLNAQLKELRASRGGDPSSQFNSQASPTTSSDPTSLANKPPVAQRPLIARKETESVQPKRIINPMAQQPASSNTIAETGKVNNLTVGTKSSSTPDHPMGMDGYCGVTLMEQQKWVKGDAKWGCFHRGRLYFFASEEYRDQFQMSPDMYSPLLGGADPVEFHDKGSLSAGLRKHGVFYGEEDGPTVIVLFTNTDNRTRFEADPAEYLRTVRQAMSRIDSDLLLR